MNEKFEFAVVNAVFAQIFGVAQIGAAFRAGNRAKRCRFGRVAALTLLYNFFTAIDTIVFDF